MKKLIVGETLYSLNINSAARGQPQILTPIKVTKIGRKYFTAGEKLLPRQYYLSNWEEKTFYYPESKLYVSEQAYLDEQASHKICRKMKEIFRYGWNNLEIPLHILQKIEKILKEEY